MYCWTVRLLTRMPSLSSSPRIRSAPHSPLAVAMAWIRSMSSTRNRPRAPLRLDCMVPEEGEQVAMPAEEGVGLDHMEGIAPRGVQPGQEHQDKPVLSVEAVGAMAPRVGVRGSAGGGARSRRQAPSGAGRRRC